MLTAGQRESWERDGFFAVEGFAGPEVRKAMVERVEAIARESDGRGRLGDAPRRPRSASARC